VRRDLTRAAPEMPFPPAIVFDLDGTLIESRHDLATAVNRMRRDLGLPLLAPETITAMVGDGARMLVRRALGDALEPERFEPAFEGFLEHYRRVCLDTTRPYDGVDALLEWLSSRVPLGLLTNKPGNLTRKILEGLGLGRRFRAVVAGDSLPARKPDPEGLRHVAGLLGAAAREVLLVGDSAIDARTARAAGCRLALVQWGFAPTGSLAEFDAEIRAESVAELDRALRALGGGPSRGPGRARGAGAKR
jgi:phosphoglycolate phosphatase